MSEKKRILIIEDDVCLTEMLQVHIEAKRNQYKVLIANDGEEGLKKIETKTPDLVILDIGLPKMGGIEVYKKLPKENGKTKIPVLVFTARGELEEFFEQIEVEGFISKPFETEVLLAEIDRIVQKKEKPVVCIIDDQVNPHVKQMQKAVKKLGYNVLVFDNVEMLKASIGKMKPSILLMEYEQSDIDGSEAIKEVKTLIKSKDATIAVYTYSDQEYKHASINAGADVYIGKPTAVIDVINAVKDIKDKSEKAKEVNSLLGQRDNPEDTKPDLNKFKF
ncbi:MAG: response regulator [Candidatus Omnitrophica bacterium]|nr:response regulator [Candidatus Omnitrophota bacterium]